MCYSVYVIVNIKDPLLIGKNSPYGSSGFALSLFVWSGADLERGPMCSNPPQILEVSLLFRISSYFTMFFFFHNVMVPYHRKLKHIFNVLLNKTFHLFESVHAIS